MKRILDKFIKFFLASLKNFLINLFTIIFIPQKIHAPKDYYLKKFNELKNEFKNKEKNKDLYFQISEDFIMDLAFKTVIVYKKSKITIDHGLLVYSELSKYIKKNKNLNLNIIETGTARGFSSVCMAKALYDANQNGKIYTFDILPHRKKIFWNNVDDINGKQTRENLLNNWKMLCDKYIIFINDFAHTSIKSLNFNRINFAFLDGSHYGHDINYEFGEIAKNQFTGDLTIFDDFDSKKYNDLQKTILKKIIELNYEYSLFKINENRNILIAKKL